MLHGNGLTIYILIIYLFDLFYRIYLVKKITKLKLDITYSLVDDNIIKIEIYNNSIIYNSGQYIYLCIPQISILEWHPFSISNSPNENITFYIKILGDWTLKLKNKIINEEKIDMLIDGFYGNISKYL